MSSTRTMSLRKRILMISGAGSAGGVCRVVHGFSRGGREFRTRIPRQRRNSVYLSLWFLVRS